MNETLLNHLRDLANPDLHRLPEGWITEAVNSTILFDHRGTEFYSWNNGVHHSEAKLLDLLFRLARAIEGGLYFYFTRDGLEETWAASNNDGDTITHKYDVGNAEQEAVALLRCILAATKVAAE